MNDGVLSRSKRGHLSEDTIRAAHLLKGKEFRVGIQLMPGLPGDTREIFASTIETVIGLRPDMVRLYPVVVIRGTELARWYQDGKYSPLPLEEAVDICAEGCSRLEHKGIPVIRIGLMSSPALLERGQILEGPWHPAFGFLVRSRIYRTKIARELTGIGPTHGIKIRAPTTAIPLIRGYRNEGLEWLKGETGARVVAIRTDDDVPDGDVRVEAL
jgi:histone acetyltransferase (RNA polymerase elongator complex component)